MMIAKNSAAAVAVFLLMAGVPAIAKDKAKSFVVVNEAAGVPVFPDDIADRPYEVLAEVKAGVRKATIFSNEASQSKVYKELWERAEKLGADAVINAKYGESHVTALSWGSTSATGTAIKFKTVEAAVPAGGAEAADSTR
jgi:uncharacterized protein YbjQ (UPF0145 family)